MRRTVPNRISPLAFLASLLLALAFFSLLPSLAYAQEKPVVTEEAISIESDFKGDVAIEKRLTSLFGQIDTLKDLRIQVVSGIVTLYGKVLEPEAMEQAIEIAQKVEGVVAVKNNAELETSVQERLAPAFERFKKRAAELARALPLLLVGLAVFFLISLFGIWLTRFRGFFLRIAPNAFLADLFRQIVRILFILLGVVVGLDIIGASALLGTILGAAGIVGLAIGFAVRDTVENYIASIMLSIRQPFRPNDHVLIEGQEGNIIALTSRATILLTFDGNHVRIPNSTVFKGIITNFTRNPYRRFLISLEVVTDEPGRAVDLGVSTLKGLDFVLDEPAAGGAISDFGPIGVNLTFTAWVDQKKTSIVKAKSEAIRILMATFETADIEIPIPTQKLAIDGLPDALTASKSIKQKSTTKKAPSSRQKQKIAESLTVSDTAVDDPVEKRTSAEVVIEQDGGLLDAQAPQEL